MKSKQEDLKKHGYLQDEIVPKYKLMSFSEKIELLQSKIATNRTLGARLLKEYKTPKTVNYLIKALKTEKKLYCKIEICNTLCELKELEVTPLISCLGVIGNNQHKTVPQKAFLKNKYPLPRDIAARTLIKIGEKTIPELLKNLKTRNQSVLSELIDAIGHINFNTKIKNIYPLLKACYLQNNTNELIQWKIICAMSGVHESETFLEQQFNKLKTKRLKQEIKRSLRLIKEKQFKQQQQQQ